QRRETSEPPWMISGTRGAEAKPTQASRRQHPTLRGIARTAHGARGDGLTSPAFLCVRLVTKFQHREPVQAVDTFTDRFHGSQYSTTPFTPHRIGYLPDQHLDVPPDHRARVVDLIGHRRAETVQ